MGKVFILGLMVGGMKDITKMIRNMVMENMPGQMERNMKVNGSMENSMEKLGLQILKVKAN